MQILLQPIGSLDHIRDVIQKVQLTPEIRDLLPPDVAEELAGKEEVELWGIKPTPELEPPYTWRNLGNAIVAFIKDNEIARLAEFEFSFIAPSLAWHLWGTDDDGRLWWCMIILKSETLTTPIPFRPSVIGYADDYIARGATLLNEEKSTAMMAYLAVELAKQPASTEEIWIDSIANDEVIRALSDADFATFDRLVEERRRRLPLSRRVVATEKLNDSELERRHESSDDAKRAREESGGVCAICGDPGFIQVNDDRYIEIHHIRPQAEGGPNERDNYLPVCPMCHRMIHYSTLGIILTHVEKLERLMDDIGHTDQTIKHVLPIGQRKKNARHAAAQIGN